MLVGNLNELFGESARKKLFDHIRNVKNLAYGTGSKTLSWQLLSQQLRHCGEDNLLDFLKSDNDTLHTSRKHLFFSIPLNSKDPNEIDVEELCDFCSNYFPGDLKKIYEEAGYDCRSESVFKIPIKLGGIDLY